VKVALNDSSNLYPGMYARMRVPLENHDQLEIPSAAVKHVGQLDLVNVVISGRVQRRAVRLGQAWGDRVEVLAGLSEGELVTVE
jgi:multidrug efflux pump subunit AcrA (membrane-fusion protein)